jgi:hypothetical protein
MRIAGTCFLAIAALAAPPGDAEEFLNKAIERHYALRQYQVEVRTSTVSGDRLQPGQRVRITVDEEGRAFRSESLSGDRAEVVSDGEWLWVRTRRRVSEHAAEGPALRSWRRGIDSTSGRFALLGRSAFETEWVKWEEIRRGKRRIACGVIRIRPSDPAQGTWQEMLWVEAVTGLIWRSSLIERGVPGQAGMMGPGPGGGIARSAPMTGWDRVRTQDFDWLHTEGDLPPEMFAKPAWASGKVGR